MLAGGAALFIGYQIYTGNEKFYRQFVIPPMQLLSAERAHVLAVKCAAWGLVPKTTYQDPPTLVSCVSFEYVQTHQNDAFVGIYHFELQVGEAEKHEKMMESP